MSVQLEIVVLWDFLTYILISYAYCLLEDIAEKHLMKVLFVVVLLIYISQASWNTVLSFDNSLSCVDSTV